MIKSFGAHLLLVAAAWAIVGPRQPVPPDAVAAVTLLGDPEIRATPTRPPVTEPLPAAVPAPPAPQPSEPPPAIPPPAIPPPAIPPPAIPPPAIPPPAISPPTIPPPAVERPPPPPPAAPPVDPPAAPPPRGDLARRMPGRSRPATVEPREARHAETASRSPSVVAPASLPRAPPATATATAATADATVAAAEAAQPTPGWDGMIAGWLAAHRTYPEAARRGNAEGDVTVRFTVAPDGHVLSVAILRGSGSAILDDAARAMLDVAVLPAPRVPRSVTVRIRYRLDQAD